VVTTLYPEWPKVIFATLGIIRRLRESTPQSARFRARRIKWRTNPGAKDLAIADISLTKEQLMIRGLKNRLSRAEIAWITGAAAAIALFLGQVAVASADDSNVIIDKFMFTPATLTVKPGSMVTFENHDTMVHNVVGVGGIFRSKPLETNDKVSIAFDKPGEFAYFCGLHPYMKGKIVVAP
jgi:plastocyanin